MGVAGLYWVAILGHDTKTVKNTALDGSISLKFSFETRLASKSFEPLIDFLAFLLSMALKLSMA